MRERGKKCRLRVRSVIRSEVTLSSSIVIHVLRPYANEEEYLAHEHFSIDAKSMLLIDQPPLPAETAVVFDVQLQNGQKPIRAEAKVLAHVTPIGDKPGGLRVRFKRFGAATKAFIDRAIALSATAPSGLPAESLAASRSAPSLVPRITQDPELATLQPQTTTRPATSDRGEPSGIHRRPVTPVAAPANREELLERLRSRARSAAARASEASPGKQTG
jgi:hypothetical protein